MKKIVSSIILAGLSMFALSAQAASDLHIANNTKSPSTVIANRGLCSSWLGKEGIAQPGEQDHIVHASKVAMACATNKKACVADVYLGDNCQTGPIASVTFNVDTGIVSAVSKDAKYKIAGTGFSIKLDPA